MWITGLTTSGTLKKLAGLLRDFCGTECSTVMHGTAFQATDAPVIYYKKTIRQVAFSGLLIRWS